MKIETTRFGEVEIDENLCFDMISPILGYDKEKKFVLVEHKEKSKFKWLQSVTTPELAFVVAIPDDFGVEYSFELPDNAQESLDITDAEDVLALNIVVIPHENPRASSINLLAPLIFNVNNKKGAQVILTGSNFKVDYPLFEKEAVC